MSSILEPRGVVYAYKGVGNYITPFVIFFVIGMIVSFGLTMLHVPITNMIIGYVQRREKKKEEKKAAKKKQKEMEEKKKIKKKRIRD
ncbi:unnamed protein product [Cercopithifilaria johnstoni]|uniref:Uncharacterized protein n=1 Tax=Cercopithifilaria johnstoni TaxID=2874296 RepID=A0A8J2M598_9BILA|nr:unnamed protein product [Cercopithifilaria johnstoni]